MLHIVLLERMRISRRFHTQTLIHGAYFSPLRLSQKCPSPHCWILLLFTFQILSTRTRNHQSMPTDKAMLRWCTRTHTNTATAAKAFWHARNADGCRLSLILLPKIPSRENYVLSAYTAPNMGKSNGCMNEWTNRRIKKCQRTRSREWKLFSWTKRMPFHAAFPEVRFQRLKCERMASMTGMWPGKVGKCNDEK